MIANYFPFQIKNCLYFLILVLQPSFIFQDLEREELPPHMTCVPTEEIRRVNTPEFNFLMMFFVYFLSPCFFYHLR